MIQPHFDEIARQTMVERGFIPDFPPEAVHQLDKIHAPAKPGSIKDLRKFLWISIDNIESKDLDQLTYAEEGKIYVAIADVDALIQKNSPIDQRAAHNTTSVYTPALIFPMLPLKLSNNLTSLNPDADRCALVVEISVAPDGEYDLIDLYPAYVRNHAKLDYPCIGDLLEHKICKHPIPPIQGLREQLFLQDALAQKILSYRQREGALEFAQIEFKPILVNGIPVAIEDRGKNRAHQLIENYMIAANVAATRFLKKKKLPALRRIVRVPKRWDRIMTIARNLGTKLPSQPDPKALRAFLLERQKASPLLFVDLSLAIIKLLGRGEYILGLPDKPVIGHFDLAEHEYSHTTAPNRRFPDLIMQRLLKSALFSQPIPYTNRELTDLAAHCTQKEDDATKVERRLNKSAAAFVMQKEIGHTFKAMVTGAAPKGTWVRLESPRIEGKLTKGFQKVDVGDYLTVKLIHVDVKNGHIDFANAS
jgi:exoribonuclease-2